MPQTIVLQADQIDIAWILRNVNLDKARKVYQPIPKSSSMIPHEFTMPALGSFQIDPYGEIEILVEIPVSELKPSEQDWEHALGRPEMANYIRWQKDGFEPPPLSVVKTDKGNLITQNRRRWLAAREAGVKSLKCWYSPTHPQHCASPKWKVTENGEDYYVLRPL